MKTWLTELLANLVGGIYAVVAIVVYYEIPDLDIFRGCVFTFLILSPITTVLAVRSHIGVWTSGVAILMGALMADLASIPLDPHDRNLFPFEIAFWIGYLSPCLLLGTAIAVWFKSLSRISR